MDLGSESSSATDKNSTSKGGVVNSQGTKPNSSQGGDQRESTGVKAVGRDKIVAGQPGGISVNAGRGG